jgi:hypothetical protein
MKNNELIDMLKNTYPRDVRKQLVKSIIEQEKVCNTIEIKDHYKTIDQILSYVLKELNWELSSNSNTWNDEPLKIMLDVFPKIEMSKWYKNKNLMIVNSLTK